MQARDGQVIVSDCPLAETKEWMATIGRSPKQNAVV